MPLTQTHFRFRADDTVALNATTFAAALDADVTFDAEKIFRLRFEVENTGAAINDGFQLQYRRNAGAWTNAWVVTSLTSPSLTKPVEVVPSTQFTDNAATTNVLAGSSQTFVAGVGSFDGTTPIWNNGVSHTEVEFAVRIRKLWGSFAIGGITDLGENIDGDVFDFRLVQLNGTAFTSYLQTPTVALNIPDGLIGGCYVEAPRTVGPLKDGNGNLYLIVEAAETNPRIAVVKSANGGTTWTSQDLLNSPTKRDIESCDAVYGNNEIFFVYQQDSDVVLGSYRASSSGAAPDTYNIKNEIVDNTIVGNTDQSVGLARRSDGSMVCVYESTPNGALRQLAYKVRSSGGVWGSPTVLDTTAAGSFTDGHAVLAAGNVVYFFYVDFATGTLFFKTLSSSNVLSARTQVATGLPTTASRERPIVPEPTYYDDAGTEKIVVAYTKADLKLYSRVITAGAVGTERNATTEVVAYDPTGTTNRMAVASLVVDSKIARLIYADAATSDIWSRESDNGAAWGAAIERTDAVTAQFLSAMVIGTDLGYFYDNGAAGTTGPIWFNKFALVGGGGGGEDPPPGGDGSPPWSPDNWPPYSWRLFAESSIWNNPIPNKNDIDPKSDIYIANFVAEGWPDLQTQQRMDNWAFPLYMGNADDDLLEVVITGSGSNYGDDINGRMIHTPPNIIPSAGADAAFKLLEQVEGFIYHFRQVTMDYTAGTITAVAGYRLPIGGNGFSINIGNTEPPTGLLPIRPEDLANGFVNHTVNLHGRYLYGSDVAGGGPVAPYDNSGGRGQWAGGPGAGFDQEPSNHLSFGHQIFLDLTVAQIDALNQPTWAKAILKGLAVYGAIMGFNGNHTLTYEHKFDRTLYGKPDPWDAVGITFPLDLGPILNEVGGWEAHLRVRTPFARPTAGANAAPNVNAGANQTITLPAQASLDGTVTDDGLPAPPAATTSTWSKVSGPGTVTFGNANAVDTIATFSVAGTYVLRLTATDGALTTTDDIQITVNPVPTGQTQRVLIVS